MNDEKIIDLFWKRDETAIKETDKKYGRYCSTVSMSILHNELDAEECVNDAYLSLWNSIPPHRPQVLRTFLGRIVRNISINRHKSTHRQGHNCYMDVSLEELMDELGDCFPSDDDMTNELSGFGELPMIFNIPMPSSRKMEASTSARNSRALVFDVSLLLVKYGATLMV